MRRLMLVLFLALILSWCEECLAEPSEIVLHTIAMESANQSDYGQYLVASVIVNRAKGSNTTLEKVCLAKRQFSCWNSHKWAFSWLSRHYGVSQEVRARKALEKALSAPMDGIRHYHTTSTMPYWAKGHKPVIIEGQHKFYNDIN